MALAWLFPAPGAAGGWMHPELLTKAGIALIFFLHGLALSFAALKAGTLRWPLHLVVQLCTFVLFPLIGVGLMAALDGRVSQELQWGVFYLCALPSTVSSSVALTAAARGNVPGALFNATLSSVLGVFLTPLWMAWAMRTSGTTMPLGPVILDLVYWLILPLVVGQLCRPWLGEWAKRNKAGINRADRGTILLLVYTSFCDSFQERIWAGHGWGLLVAVTLGSAALFAVVMLVSGAVARALGFSREDRIAAMFCGSKKSMASGVPMAKLLFGAHAGLGVILLPIMIYHPLQLLLCGWLAGRWAREAPPSA
ncbi:MAG: bile acid:sodium symporter [Opitutaceae bacterium]|nr:bile acid:sodium symporter [Opitutaceae bacterium]